MKTKKILSVLISLFLTLTLFSGCSKNENNKKTGPSPTATDNPYGLRDKVEDGTILQCFSWSFATITESMEDIAMAGYSTIQTSPVNACYDGGDGGMDLFGSVKWYYHYQPTDWTIGNYQLGTRDEFKTMCDTAHSYGIKVLVDVAPNHTTPATQALGKDLLEAVGGLDNLYHKDGMTDISDYTDRAQCTLNAVGGLYDVNTENPDFQDYFIAYLNDVISCGADGFRYDTAKHIGLSDDPLDDENLPNNFWDRVTTEVTDADQLFMYGECLQDGGERLEDYIDTIGATTASAYGEVIRSTFGADMLSVKALSDLKIGEATPNVVTWVESHDNYTGSDATYKSVSKDTLKLGWTFLAARSAGTPLFFARPYGSTENAMWGTFNKIGMTGDNLYKDLTVVAANHFRNAMTGLEENIFNPEEDGTETIAIERDTKGLVIINDSEKDKTLTFDTNLEDGTYEDRVSGNKFTVKNGSITCDISKLSAVILYNDGYVALEAPASLKVSDDTKGSFTGDSIEVTLEAVNAKNATYKIDGGKEISFSDGDKILLGKGLNTSETTKLTLKGENEAGNITCISYIFKKQETIPEGTTVYFEKPEDWGNNVSCYVYDETSYDQVKQNATWPGSAMTLEENGTYSYTLEEELLAPLVIFSDGIHQSNGTMEPGADIVADKVYKVK